MTIVFDQSHFESVFEMIYNMVQAEADYFKNENELNPPIVQPSPVDVELAEEGYDWESEIHSLEVTGINGTHGTSLRVDPTSPCWMNSIETAILVLSNIEDFPGWKIMHIEGGWKGFGVRLMGGKYVPGASNDKSEV